MLRELSPMGGRGRSSTHSCTSHHSTSYPRQPCLMAKPSYPVISRLLLLRMSSLL